ncbi:fam-c protein [Plasmodium vinckei lentum]|uniref:Fam-c protein n=1 Tax=Plasmodium vinckei lentum TaxID=138297 RepID=A0A6V7SCS1_PLAVN|nr:fam-c protein [Plasmodium vinckei lentum]
MNKRIFSLVCILFYVLMAVLIYCSEQKDDRSKESSLRSRIIRAFKKTKRSNKKNDIESQREIQSNNNNNYHDECKRRQEAEANCCYCCWPCLYDDDIYY